MAKASELQALIPSLKAADIVSMERWLVSSSHFFSFPARALSFASVRHHRSYRTQPVTHLALSVGLLAAVGVEVEGPTGDVLRHRAPAAAVPLL
eukprot:COSAG01_NODE_1224_length_11142_cov_72.842615_4_plen_94_part_00